ncbi:uncharacterized protein METZ01_LOCUS516852, partial [marine metagenome]
GTAEVILPFSQHQTPRERGFLFVKEMMGRL